jgi:hypothetical protein
MVGEKGDGGIILASPQMFFMGCGSLNIKLKNKYIIW